MVANEPKNTVSSFQFSRAKKLVKFVCAEECAKNLTDRFCAFFAGAEYSFLFPRQKTRHAQPHKACTIPKMHQHTADAVPNYSSTRVLWILFKKF